MIAVNPEQIKRIANPSEAAQWLAVMRKPQLAADMPNLHEPIKLAALVVDPTLSPKLSWSLPFTPKQVILGRAQFHIEDQNCQLIHLKPTRV